MYTLTKFYYDLCFFTAIFCAGIVIRISYEIYTIYPEIDWIFIGVDIAFLILMVMTGLIVRKMQKRANQTNSEDPNSLLNKFKEKIK